MLQYANRNMFLSDEGPIRSKRWTLLYPYRQYTATFLYLDFYLNTAYAAHYVYLNMLELPAVKFRSRLQSVLIVFGLQIIPALFENCRYKPLRSNSYILIVACVIYGLFLYIVNYPLLTMLIQLYIQVKSNVLLCILPLQVKVLSNELRNLFFFFGKDSVIHFTSLSLHL